MRPSLTVLAAAAGIFVAGAAAAVDGAPAALTLRQAIERAAGGNIQLRRQNIALRTSAANVLAAEGQFDFVLAADGSYGRRVNLQLRPDTPSAFTDTWLFDLSLSRQLETGGRLTLSGTEQIATSNSAALCNVPPCTGFSPSLTLSFAQPLLRGFGREIAEANLRKQRITQDLALLNRQAQASLSVRDTITAYWELAYQTQDLEIRRSAEALAREQLRTTEAQIQVGRMGALEAAAVHRAIAQAQQEVSTSEQLLTARALDLQRLFGAAVPRGFPGYKAADALNAPGHEVAVDSETTHALEASPALKSLRKGLALSDIDVQVALASLRPQLDLGASVGRVGRDLNFGESLRQLTRNEDTVWSAGLTFSLPVQNRAARGAAEVARAAGDSARLDAEDLDLAIRDGVARLAAQIRSASQRIDFARAAVGFAEQNLTAERARFDVGRSTNNDVLLRQQELKQAQISVARAIVDLLDADVALSALTGDVLETYGITLRP
jgi:outer membrane protein